MKTTLAVALGAAMVGMSACASAPEDIHATYTPATRWQGETCKQLAEETARIGSDVDRVTGQQRQKRQTDQFATGIGVVLFWPALIAMPLTKDHKAELARLKGEYEAVQREQEAQRCGAPSPAVSPAALPPGVTPAASKAAAS